MLAASRPQEHSGLKWLPDGEEVYSRAIRRHTSLDLEAGDIHQIGLGEIEQLGDEYRDLGETVLGTSDLQEIYGLLRDDTELRFETSDEVREAARVAMERARDEIPDWFGRLPITDCVMADVPEPGAEDAPLAYYLSPAGDGSRPGTFFVNTTLPTTRTRYEAEALAFHESIPGHHLQLAIAQEIEDIPEFRKHGLVTVYAEGWGLYSERLADEMGLYTSDLARLGIPVVRLMACGKARCRHRHACPRLEPAARYRLLSSQLAPGAQHGGRPEAGSATASTSRPSMMSCSARVWFRYRSSKHSWRTGSRHPPVSPSDLCLPGSNGRNGQRAGIR